ncbi:hypothetical protein [Francisella sp. LA112445]|uniref:hypothetical protein n=1 Tax=Francisella sp. LA112445 TaxID=1395624 RepID=UPI001788AFA9|nr:hypothetical protein [Francisella sp. LA112445]QIW10418.1 hypothetical protein FIP56_06775 [Francisella sp. LA112445]
MKKIALILLSIVMSSSVYAADVQLSSGSQINTGDLNCLQLQKHAGKKSFCLPSKKPESCSAENYDKLKSNVQECSFKVRGSLRSAL